MYFSSLGRYNAIDCDALEKIVIGLCRGVFIGGQAFGGFGPPQVGNKVKTHCVWTSEKKFSCRSVTKQRCWSASGVQQEVRVNLWSLCESSLSKEKE